MHNTELTMFCKRKKLIWDLRKLFLAQTSISLDVADLWTICLLVIKNNKSIDIYVNYFS